VLAKEKERNKHYPSKHTHIHKQKVKPKKLTRKIVD